MTASRKRKPDGAIAAPPRSPPGSNPSLTMTWRIPDFASQSNTICSRACTHHSGLDFQLVMAMDHQGYLALYLVCSNVSTMRICDYATVNFTLQMKSNSASTQVPFTTSGRYKFTNLQNNSFEVEGCHNFAPRDKVIDHLSDYLDEEKVVVVCELQVETNYKPQLSPSVQTDERPYFPPVETLDKGDIVAVKAENGFWLAKLEQDIDFDFGRAVIPPKCNVRVQWLEELPKKKHLYQLLKARDDISVRSIHPISIVVKPEGKFFRLMHSTGLRAFLVPIAFVTKFRSYPVLKAIKNTVTVNRIALVLVSRSQEIPNVPRFGFV